MKKLSQILMLFCIALASNAQQKEGSIWYFGNNAGIDFNASPPRALTNGAINTIEGCATICNPYGNLLFYTDGSNVYNKNHALMTNGNGLRGNPSSTQSGIIVPNPTQKQIYYVFSASGFGDLHYSTVDTTKQSGLGEVTVKNVRLMRFGTEKLNAVKHSNGTDTWVVSHQRDNNSFYAYRVSGSGVDTVPVISNSGSLYNVRSYSPGWLKFSPKGDLLVSADYFGIVELFDFNPTTGVISNARTLINSSNYYGVEFSASGDLLYVTKGLTSSDELLQFDMKAGSIADIRASKTVIANSFNKNAGALQLAPDGKIYMAFYSRGTHLGVINKPEKKGTACDFVENGFALSPKTSSWGLPSFNQSFFYRPNSDIETKGFECGSLTTEIYNIGDTANIISSKWDFGDGTKDSGLKFTKTYPKHGSFLLTNIIHLQTKDSLIIDTLTKTIKTRPMPKAYFWVNNSSQCYNTNQFDFEDSSEYFFGAKYKGNAWSLGDNNPDIENRNSGQKRYSRTGTYNVRLIVESDDGCFDTAVRQIIVKPSPKSWFSAIDKAQCFTGNQFSFIQSSYTDTPLVLSKYDWSFGDGSVSKAPSPTKTYTDTGSYPIKLEVTNSGNCKNTTYDTLIVLPVPQAKFTVTDVCHKDSTTLINQSITQTTSSLNHHWDFGDGNSSNLPNPKHYYQDSGKKTIKLIITSTNSCQDSISKEVIVYPKPKASFTAQGNCIQHPTTYTNTSQYFNSTPTSSTWQLAPNKTSNNLQQTSTTYTNYGTKTITLHIKDQHGCQDSITKQHHISPLPQVAININQEAQCIKGNNFIITDASTLAEGNIQQYNWYINNLLESQNQNPASQTFNKIGSYTIKLITQTDSGCIDSGTRTIQVHPQIQQDISIQNPAQCYNQHQFTITDNSTVSTGSITKHHWIYSDNSTETTPNPSPKKFSKDGNYTLTAIQETDKGCKDTLEKPLTVYYSPQPEFTTADICFGDSAYFDNNTPNKDSVDKWQWDFGDGTTSNIENPYRKYPATGNYQITLIATTKNNCKDTQTNYYPNLVKPQPRAYFEYTLLDSYGRYTTIKFTNNSTQGDNNLWDFGDGSIETIEHPEKIYDQIGQLTVTLTVNNQWGCEDQYSKKIYVVPTSYINIPTAFTPGNSDELNQYFKVEGIYYTKEIDLKIFNRWGTLLYHSTQTDPKWDGRYKGELVQDGVYLYAIRILDYKNKVHIYNGTVTVIK